MAASAALGVSAMTHSLRPTVGSIFSRPQQRMFVPFTIRIPSILPRLKELLPPWVLAVPKKKTSHSKKRMRASGKGLKEQRNIVSCPACGLPKKAHHICQVCLRDFQAEVRREKRGEVLEHL